MIFEHFALNVSDPLGFVKWYTENFEMKAVKCMDKPPYTHFLADESGRTIMEIYSNPSAKFPDFRSMHLLEFHFAFSVDDIEGKKSELLSAGAELIMDAASKDGERVVTFRDPFGSCVQICKRPSGFFSAR